MADEAENARPKGLLIPFDKLKLLSILDDKAFREVFLAMAGYVQNGIEPDALEPIEQIAFESMRQFLDENVKTYQRTVEANRENGRKGGRPRKPAETGGLSEKPKKTDGFLEKPMETEENPSNPKETHENQSAKYKVQSTTDTKVSDTTTVVEHDLDADLSKIAHRFQEAFGDLPPSVGYKISSWRQTFSAEMIILAIDRAAEAGKRNWTYVDGTLRNWKRDGIKTPAEVAASDEQWQSRQQARPGSATGGRKPAESVDDQLTRVLANMDRKRGFEQ